MATSGTIGQTIISTAKVLEHALRRAGVAASVQTPETVDIARECLYLLLMHYANTSLNLWCIEKVLIGYSPDQAEYALPAGTNDVLNVLTGTPLTADITSVAVDKVTLAQQGKVTRLGLTFSVPPAVPFTISVSSDDVAYTQVASLANNAMPLAGQMYWVDFDPAATGQYITVSAGTLSGAVAATSTTEIEVTVLNRDQYAELPNKTMQSATVTNYLFSKTLSPTLTLWPVPNDMNRHMILWLHRQVQDVGGLTQTLAVPQRWFEPTIIQLAFRLAMELPGIDPARITMLSGLADKFKIEVTSAETDSAPMFISPAIAAYTR